MINNMTASNPEAENTVVPHMIVALLKVPNVPSRCHTTHAHSSFWYDNDLGHLGPFRVMPPTWV